MNIGLQTLICMIAAFFLNVAAKAQTNQVGTNTVVTIDLVPSSVETNRPNLSLGADENERDLWRIRLDTIPQATLDHVLTTYFQPTLTELETLRDVGDDIGFLECADELNYLAREFALILEDRGEAIATRILQIEYAKRELLHQRNAYEDAETVKDQRQHKREVHQTVSRIHKLETEIMERERDNLRERAAKIDEDLKERRKQRGEDVKKVVGELLAP